MPSLRLQMLLPLLLLVAQQPVTDAAGPEHYAALGVPESATGLDVQLSYMNQCTNYDVGTKLDAQERRDFVRSSQAFQQLADGDSQADVLKSVKYEEHITTLSDDQGLQRFVELQTGGNAHLRIVFFLENKAERHWGIWAAATQLNGNVRVAQMFHQDTHGSDGHQGPFMAGLKLQQFPAALIYDPISRAMKVSFGLDGILDEAQKFIEGSLTETDRLLRLQELNTESFRHRCGETEEEIKTRCDTALVVATSGDYESKREELMETLRTVVDGCRLAHNLVDIGKSFACFWVRFDHAPAWKAVFTKGGMGYYDNFALATVQWHPQQTFVVAPENTAKTPFAIQTWFRGQVFGTPGPVAEQFPALPAPIDNSAGSSEGALTEYLRLFRQFLAKYEIEPDLGKLQEKVETYFNKLDTEEKVMAVGAGLCAVMLVLVIFKNCCCRGRAPPPSEDVLLNLLKPLIPVVLQKQEGEKLGMGITPYGQAYLVTSVRDGDLVHRWNMQQAQPERRIRENDQIVAVTAKGERACNTKDMGNLLKATGEVTLTVAMDRAPDVVLEQRITGCVLLTDMALKDAVELRAPQATWAGTRVDAHGLEVAAVKPALSAWAEARRAEGSCCMQVPEVGDRVVAINSQTSLKLGLDAKGPTVLLARFGAQGRFTTESVQVTIDKKDAEDRLGMHIQSLPGSGCIQVLDILPSGAVHRQNENMGAGQGVARGDRIISVNGETEYQKMQGALGSMNVTITAERFVVSGAAGGGFSNGNGNRPAHVPPPMPKAEQAPAATPAAQPEKPPAAPKEAAKAPAAAGGASKGGFFFVALGVVAAVVALLLPQSGDAPVSADSSLSDVMLGRNPKSDQYMQAALGMLGVGALLACYFVWYEVRGLMDPSSRGTLPQILVAALSSVFLGYGNFYLFTWAGVYA